MKFFDTLIKRVVSFPIESYTANAGDIHAFFIKNKLFQLAVLTASRSLYDDAQKNKTEKIRQSLDKYFTRAHFNPIPFGAFSSIGCIAWNDKTKLTKSETTSLKVDFDNLFISKKNDTDMHSDWKKPLYYTNPSVHFLSDEKISFYKSEKKTSGDLETKYVETDYDENIQWLIERFKDGVFIADVVEDLTENGFEVAEINAFLLGIIDVGIILSDTDFHPYSKPLQLREINSKLVNENLHQLDTTANFNNFIENYIDEQDDLLSQDKSHGASYSHSITSYEENADQIAETVQEKIVRYIKFTETYNGDHNPINKTLLEFGNKFYHSFKDGYVSLGTVFNPYSGLKYSDIHAKTESKLHADILLKLVSASANEVHLSTPIAEKKQSDYSKLPATFSVIFELLVCKNTAKEIIYFKYMGGTSAINFISRFDEATRKTCQDIADFEKEIYADKIIAELNLVAKPRATNIAASRQYYDYNIPLNTVYPKGSNPLFLSDLYLNFNGYRFSLVSEKHQEEIIPRVTSAVNNALSDSEIYKFLADLQSQNTEIHHVNFNLNYYKNMFLEYAPRIYLEDDILLYPAQLIILNRHADFDTFKKDLLERIVTHSFSKKVSFTDDKGEMIINVENDEHLAILYAKLKKNTKVYVAECLYESFVPKMQQASNHYAHEIIASIKNTAFKSGKVDFKILKSQKNTRTNAPILSDWLYFDLFCNTYAENDVLHSIHQNIISKYEITDFFFVRYDYPENHLRVRFKVASKSVNESIIYEIDGLKTKHIILKYHLLPYEQEVYRYGGDSLMALTEQLFSIDSSDTLTQIISEGVKDNQIYLYAIKKIISFLSFFDFQMDDMIVFCEKNIGSFSNEFTLDSDLRKSFNKTFSEIRNNAEVMKSEDFLKNTDLQKAIKNELKNSDLVKENYIVDLIHMSLNRVFNEKQRFNEFKSYYLAKCYLNQIKFTHVKKSIH